MPRCEKTYFVGGVNAAGKSTFLDELKKRGPEFSVFYSSQKFMRWLEIEPGNYKALRSLPDKFKNQEFDRMMRGVLEEAEGQEKILIIDAHYLNLRRGEIYDVTGSWMALVDAFFLVTADHQTIWRRIQGDQSDKGRNRALFAKDSRPQEQQALLKSYVAQTEEKMRQVSDEYGIPCFIILNEDNRLGESIKLFLDHHRSLSK